MNNEKQLLQEIFMFSSEKIISERFSDLQSARCNGRCASGSCRAMINMTDTATSQAATEFWGTAAAGA